MKVFELVGIDNANKLVLAKIRSVELLRKKGATAEGRKRISEASAIPLDEVLAWVERADLMRIPGVGVEYSGVLQEIGFKSPLDLKEYSADVLLERMMAYNGNGGQEVRMPALTQVAVWLENTADLEGIIQS